MSTHRGQPMRRLREEAIRRVDVESVERQTGQSRANKYRTSYHHPMRFRRWRLVGMRSSLRMERRPRDRAGLRRLVARATRALAAPVPLQLRADARRRLVRARVHLVRCHQSHARGCGRRGFRRVAVSPGRVSPSQRLHLRVRGGPHVRGHCVGTRGAGRSDGRPRRGGCRQHAAGRAACADPSTLSLQRAAHRGSAHPGGAREGRGGRRDGGRAAPDVHRRAARRGVARR
jgi:hypothetical protein